MTVPVAFFQHPPSTQWEPFAVRRLSGVVLWAWYRPQTLPNGFLISVPPELIQSCPAGLPMTLLDVLDSAGVPWQCFHAVSVFGGDWQPASVVTPFLNHPVPTSSCNGRFEICISVAEPALAVMSAPAVPGVGSVEGHYGLHAEMTDSAAGWDVPEYEDFGGQPQTEGMMFERIEAAWKTSMQVERQLAGTRQKLSAMQATLGKLDRDLTSEERLASEREDRDAWEDARRWLRDLATKCHREIKAYDIGVTSGAGRRHLMEGIITQIIEPRVPNADMERYQRDFETYRRDMINLQKAMVSALQSASQNGTQRAQRVLGQISVKIRERRARNREAIGGVNMDKSCRGKKR